MCIKGALYRKPLKLFTLVPEVDSSVLMFGHVHWCKQGFNQRSKTMVNCVDPDETALYELSHLDLYCLQMYLSWSTGLKVLTLKAQSRFAADNILKLILLV